MSEKERRWNEEERWEFFKLAPCASSERVIIPEGREKHESLEGTMMQRDCGRKFWISQILSRFCQLSGSDLA
jgi:hypothetical protein